MNTNETYINKQEVARRLGKTLRTVDNWMRLGILPYYKLGRSIMFKWSDVEEHIGAKCRRVNNPPASHVEELEYQETGKITP